MISAGDASAISQTAEAQKRILEAASKGNRCTIMRDLTPETRQALHDAGYSFSDNSDDKSRVHTEYIIRW